ncbi:MAG TPA: D-alanyl-D-alanine carboxypeptidase [Streptosporangiaceae bacterium]|nr:D-alanyl-D-alanine carboxypeptidase [Streptosporangiaceae bacterium]
MRSRLHRPAATLAGLAAAIGLAAMPSAAGAAAVHAVFASHAVGRAPTVAKQDVGGAELASPGVAVHYPASGARPLPQVPASAYVIADAKTGQVLAAKDAHGLFPPASTLKMLTAITLIPRLHPDATVLATQQAADTEEYDVGLIAGHRYKVSDLFNALLLISANDAAVALTQATGSLARGMAMINAEAHHLQAYDVVAKQPNGLPAAGQVTSAYDQALIARQGLAMPAFMKYDSTRSAEFPISPKRSVPLVNQNTLLTDYPGGIGGKIGWTDAAEATYIGMARRNGTTLIVTVLHCTSLEEITSGEKLLNWGFAMDGKVRPVGELVSPLPAVTTSRVAHHPAGQRAGTPATAAADAPASPGLPAGPLAATCSLALIAGLGGAWLLRQRRSPAASTRGAPLRPPPADGDPGQSVTRQDPATPGGGIRSGP